MAVSKSTFALLARMSDPLPSPFPQLAAGGGEELFAHPIRERFTGRFGRGLQ
jgi:hypothetical protein